MYKTYCLCPHGYSSAPSMFNRGCFLTFQRQARGFQPKEICLHFTTHGQTRHQGTMFLTFNTKSNEILRTIYIDFAQLPLHSAKFSCSRPVAFRGGSPLHGTPLKPIMIRIQKLKHCKINSNSIVVGNLPLVQFEIVFDTQARPLTRRLRQALRKSQGS